MSSARDGGVRPWRRRIVPTAVGVLIVGAAIAGYVSPRASFHLPRWLEPDEVVEVTPDLLIGKWVYRHDGHSATVEFFPDGTVRLEAFPSIPVPAPSTELRPDWDDLTHPHVTATGTWTIGYHHIEDLPTLEAAVVTMVFTADPNPDLPADNALQTYELSYGSARGVANTKTIHFFPPVNSDGDALDISLGYAEYQWMEFARQR